MNWRAILGLGKDCTLAQAKAAYRKLAARYHPDKGTQGNSAKMVEINLAWARAQEEFGDPKAKAKATSSKTKASPRSGRPNFRKARKQTYTPPPFDPAKPLCGSCGGRGQVRVAVKYQSQDVRCPRCHGWGNDALA